MDNITLTTAKKVADYAEELVAQEYGRKPFSVAVCDKDGFPVLFHKLDGAKLLTINLTPNKAYTAARMGVSTADFLQRLQRENLNISYFSDEKFVGLPGGVPIVNDRQQVIGAVGIGGMKEDGEIAAKVAAAAPTL
ncbi:MULTISPECIES: heme-binding protein [Sporomusa]|uniref:GlcG/HbpS family heme-binding protein n=1 Tax=Sporomusa TaxID=2375 RepID=UPI001669F408|nr:MULTISPECIES: heme-binding protein [Sporomusa]MCM0760415.1 heme-binding protein [Sporomusa sphaeroides DSM 2875]